MVILLLIPNTIYIFICDSNITIRNHVLLLVYCVFLALLMGKFTIIIKSTRKRCYLYLQRAIATHSPPMLTALSTAIFWVQLEQPDSIVESIRQYRLEIADTAKKNKKESSVSYVEDSRIML